MKSKIIEYVKERSYLVIFAVWLLVLPFAIPSLWRAMGNQPNFSEPQTTDQPSPQSRAAEPIGG